MGLGHDHGPGRRAHLPGDGSNGYAKGHRRFVDARAGALEARSFLRSPLCVSGPARRIAEDSLLGWPGLLLVCQASRERAFRVANHQGRYGHTNSSAVIDAARGNRVASPATDVDPTSRWISQDRDDLTHRVPSSTATRRASLTGSIPPSTCNRRPFVRAISTAPGRRRGYVLAGAAIAGAGVTGIASTRTGANSCFCGPFRAMPGMPPSRASLIQ